MGAVPPIAARMAKNLACSAELKESAMMALEMTSRGAGQPLEKTKTDVILQWIGPPHSIVDLQLDKFHFRMPDQNVLQFFRRGVEGKADVTDQPFGLFLPHKAPYVKIVKETGPVLA